MRFQVEAIDAAHQQALEEPRATGYPGMLPCARLHLRQLSLDRRPILDQLHRDDVLGWIDSVAGIAPQVNGPHLHPTMLHEAEGVQDLRRLASMQDINGGGGKGQRERCSGMDVALGQLRTMLVFSLTPDDPRWPARNA